MEEKIKIENENLANYVMFKLDKLDNEFTEQELNQITEVVLDYNESRESSFIFIKELEKLKNLRFSEDDVEKIKEEVIKDTGTILKSNGSKLDEKIKKFKAESQEETTNSSIT